MWTIKEKNNLIEMYPDTFNADIAKKLNKTKSAVDILAFRLKLKKSKVLLEKISTLRRLGRIANGGRNLTFEALKSIASNFKTRIDFITNDNSAYQSARKMGVLDEICQHMTVMKFSIPQLILREITDKILGLKSIYNDRKALKPYEIDIFYKEYKSGFEFQGVAWHKDNKNDSTKLKMAEEKGIKIIYISEDSRNYEKDIKSQLIKQLDIINGITNNKITPDIITNCIVDNVYLKLYNKEELINIASEYKTFKAFVKNEQAVYRKLRKLKLIDEATSHMPDKKKISDLTKNDIVKVLKKYKNLTDFRKNELNLYKNIKRNKQDGLIEHLKRTPSFDIEKITKEVSKHTFKCKFIKNNKQMYKFIRKNGLTYLLKGLKNCNRGIIF